VIVDEKVWAHLKRAISSHIYKINPKWNPPSEFQRFLLDAEVIKLLKALDEHINDILENVPKTYRAKAKKVLMLLSKNIDKTLEYVYNPPDWLRGAALIDMLNNFGVPAFSRAILEKHAEELAKAVPFRADVEYKGNKLPDAVVLYPSDDELRELKFSVTDAYSDFISILSSRYILVPERHSAKLFEYEIFFPRSAYYKILDRHDMHDVIKKMVEEDLQDVLQELRAFGTVVHSSPTIITINLSKNILDSINKTYGINIKSAEVVISLTPSERRGSVRVDAVVESLKDYRKFVVVYGYPAICVSGKCNDVPKSEIKFSDYSEIVKTVKLALDRLAELVAYTKMYVNRFAEEAEKHGYTISNISYPESYYTFTNIKAIRSFRHAVASVNMNIDYNNASVTLSVEVSLPLERTPSTDLATDALRRAGERPEYYNIRAHKGWTISRKGWYSIDEMGEVFEKATKIAEALDAVYEEFESEKKLKKSVKIPAEHYVAIFLTNELRTGLLDRVSVDVERALGRPYIAIYGVLRSVVSKYAPDAVEFVGGDHPIEVAYRLFVSKYITIDTDLKVYINGQRYADIVMKYGISPTDAEAKEKAIALTLIAQHVYRNQNKPIVVSLNEVGLLHDNVVSTIMSEVGNPFRPEEMAMEICGKPVWHQLSPQTKKLYLLKASINDLATILFDARLREVFSDVINQIKNEVLRSREPSIITRYTVEYMPNTIGLPKNAKIVSEGKLYAIDVGPFIVQVWSVGDEHNNYIVYNKNTKIGFLFAGKTVLEAVSDAMLRYEKIYKVYEELRNMARGDKLYSTYRVSMIEKEAEGYRFYYLRSWRDDRGIIHIDENIMKKLEKLQKGEEIYDEVVMK